MGEGRFSRHVDRRAPQWQCRFPRRLWQLADLDHKIPNKPDTVFHAASLTKQFTAMAIMMLIDNPSLANPHITLNTNVHTLVPELSGITDPITISQLLHHISGIRDQWVLATMAGWRLSDDVVTRDDVMNRFVGLSKSLNFAPGNRYSYSNTNYTIAAEIVKKVSGLSLSAFCQQHIFHPLGMTKTKIIETHGEIVQDRAYGYRVPPATNVGWEVRMPNYDLTGPTNLQTTVEDLMLWDANFDTMTVGGAAAFAAMLAKRRRGLRARIVHRIPGQLQHHRAQRTRCRLSLAFDPLSGPEAFDRAVVQCGPA